MKRILLTLFCLFIATAAALCEVNEVLRDAQESLQNATTLEDYRLAKKKFISARDATTYNEAEHEEAILQGISACDAKINELESELRTTPSSVSFGPLGGSIDISVISSHGAPKISSNRSWLKITAGSGKGFKITCEANPSSVSRSAVVTLSISTGKTASVDVTQSASLLKVTGVDFGSTDARGMLTVDYGSPLYSDEVCHLRARLTYSSPDRKAKTVYTRIIKPDGSTAQSASSPEGFTQKMDCVFESGGGTLVMNGFGASQPGYYLPGEYAYEVWIDNKCAASAGFTVEEKFDGVHFNSLEFGAQDGNGGIVAAFGGDLRQDVVPFVVPRIEYTSSAPVEKMIFTKVYCPDGTLWTNSASPQGYSAGGLVSFDAGSGHVVIEAIGWPEPGKFQPGQYNCEVWCDGERVISSTFSIDSRSQNLEILGVELGSRDKRGNTVIRYGDRLKHDKVLILGPKVRYYAPEHVLKRVYYKYIDPSGRLVAGSNSPEGFSFYQDVHFKRGTNAFEGNGLGTGTSGFFSAGTYRVEIWFDKKCQWSGEFIMY